MDPSVPQALLGMGLILLLSLMVLHKTLGRRNWPLLELILHVERDQGMEKGQGLYNPCLLYERQKGSCKGVSKEPNNSDYLWFQGE